jgi:hypothetical protein
VRIRKAQLYLSCEAGEDSEPGSRKIYVSKFIRDQIPACPQASPTAANRAAPFGAFLLLNYS